MDHYVFMIGRGGAISRPNILRYIGSTQLDILVFDLNEQRLGMVMCTCAVCGKDGGRGSLDHSLVKTSQLSPSKPKLPFHGKHFAIS